MNKSKKDASGRESSRVQNIKISKFNLHDEVDKIFVSKKENNKTAALSREEKDFQKSIKLLQDNNLTKEQIKDLLPKNDKITVSFDLVNTNTDIANGIRRCLSDEITIHSFDFDEHKDLETTDVFILSEFIKKQMDLLPINQELDYNGIIIELKKENTTDEIIDVTSGDLIISGSFKQSDLTKIVSTTITLCRLRPSENIHIKNIKICSGIAKQDAGKFSAFSNISYKIYNVDPVVETREGQTGISSLLTNPDKFSISYTTHRNIKHPEKYMIKCCDILIDRFTIILQDMKEISNKDTQYTSALINLETSGNLHKIQFKNEYWTVINLIARYCFILTKGDIKFVSPALIHPETETGVINITHPEYSTLIQNSIKAIIAEFEIIKKAF